jgi:hypothetical protein
VSHYQQHWAQRTCASGAVGLSRDQIGGRARASEMVGLRHDQTEFEEACKGDGKQPDCKQEGLRRVPWCN